MQNPFLPFLLLLFIQGVFGADETVNEGDSVTLQTGVTEIQNEDMIMWMFGPQNMVLCQITRKDDRTPISFTDDVRFRGRLQVDQKTGSLTIRNTRIKHSGDYKLTISRAQDTTEIFKVTVKSVVNETDGVKSISVKEGESVTLNTHTDIHPDDLIVWRFGDKGILLAKIDVGTNETSLNKADERFRDRLKLDQTGSLIITNTRTEHSGLYELQIRDCESSQRFLLSVTEPLSSGVVAGIVGVLLLVFAAAAFRVYLLKIPKRQNQTWKKTVKEGDPVTLKPVTGINKGDQIQLMETSGDEDTLIAEIKGGREIIHDGRFKDRLELDKKTGSFTIRDTTPEDSGVYKILIRRGIRTLYEKFYISVIEPTISKTEGESVTLHTNTEIQKDHQIQCMFGDKYTQTAIAEIRGDTEEIFTYDYVADGRFRGRLKLDKKTGSLTITNSRTTDSGVYKLHIVSNSGVSVKTFSVIVRDKVEEKLLKCEDSVTLTPDAEIQREDLFLWTFGDGDTFIAQIRGGIIKYDDGPNGIFRGKLELDKKTGSLTITNIRAEHIGLYKLQIINSRRTSYKKFKVLIQMSYELVTEGKSITLHSGLNQTQKDDRIQWMFGAQDILIAEIRGGTGKTHDDDDDEWRFRGRLKLDEKTGSLTIMNITAEHAGHYKLKIRSSKVNITRTYIVIVRASGKSVTEGKNEKRVNKSATVEMPLLNVEDVNEQEGTSSL